MKVTAGLRWTRNTLHRAGEQKRNSVVRYKQIAPPSCRRGCSIYNKRKEEDEATAAADSLATGWPVSFVSSSVTLLCSLFFSFTAPLGPDTVAGPYLTQRSWPAGEKINSKGLRGPWDRMQRTIEQKAAAGRSIL